MSKVNYILGHATFHQRLTVADIMDEVNTRLEIINAKRHLLTLVKYSDIYKFFKKPEIMDINFNEFKDLAWAQTTMQLNCTIWGIKDRDETVLEIMAQEKKLDINIVNIDIKSLMVNSLIGFNYYGLSASDVPGFKTIWQGVAIKGKSRTFVISPRDILRKIEEQSLNDDQI